MTLVLVLTGLSSAYRPGDGHNHGELACGGRFTRHQNHIAIRQWRKVGCGAPAVVCVAGGRCAPTKVMDSGPWGAVKGKRWEVQVPKLQPGWRRRGVVDLSWGLWQALGRPRFLSKVTIWIYRRKHAPR